jgi:hypothetical protein
MITKDLVVARYNEDIAWLSKINPNYNLKIYNKGEDNISFNFTKLKNWGGDAHTFIYHIVNNYDILADYTGFVQGTPFDHCEKTIKLINSHTTEGFIYLADHICTENISGWYEHLITRRPPEYPVMMLCEAGYHILGSECPTTVVFGAGQQFIVSKEIIRSRSKEFYKRILDRFEIDFLLPWHIERLWKSILNV